MAGSKKSISFEIQSDLVEMLNDAVEKYDLPDINKAMRCILDYVASDGDWENIFNTRRCLRCGSNLDGKKNNI